MIYLPFPCKPTRNISAQRPTFTTTNAAKRTLVIQNSQPHRTFPLFSPANPPHHCNPKLRCSSPTHNADQVLPSISPSLAEEILKTVDFGGGDQLANQSIWNQIAEIIKFSGSAVGLWLCGPLMTLIDTTTIRQASSIELAALGPSTVFCDYMSYVFMFLCIATSNLVATSLAQQDDEGLRC